MLTNTNGIIESRSKVAKAMKDNELYLEKEKERAKKEWEEEQALRVKSNTIVLDAKTW